eukprot:g810.t1
MYPAYYYLGYQIDRDRNGTYECGGDRPGYTFGDFPAMALIEGGQLSTQTSTGNDPCNTAQHWNVVEYNSESKGCYNGGWGGDLSVWVKGPSLQSYIINEIENRIPSANLAAPPSFQARRCPVGQFFGQYYSATPELANFSKERVRPALDREPPLLEICESRPFVSSPFVWENPAPTVNTMYPGPKFIKRENKKCVIHDQNISRAYNDQKYQVTAFVDICMQSCLNAFDCDSFLYIHAGVPSSGGLNDAIGVGACFFAKNVLLGNCLDAANHDFYEVEIAEPSADDSSYYNNLASVHNVPGLNPGNLIVRWTGALHIRETGIYRFYDMSSDTSRLWIDDVFLGRSAVQPPFRGINDLQMATTAQIWTRYWGRSIDGFAGAGKLKR